MGRKKGSKNKPKRTLPERDAEQFVPEQQVPIEDDELTEEYPSETTLPDAEPIESDPDDCKTCGHEKAKHYGPVNQPNITWCNRGGCQCQAFRSK